MVAPRMTPLLEAVLNRDWRKVGNCLLPKSKGGRGFPHTPTEPGDEQRATPFQSAALGVDGHESAMIVAMFVDAGADPHFRGREGPSPATIMAVTGRHRMLAACFPDPHELARYFDCHPKVAAMAAYGQQIAQGDPMFHHAMVGNFAVLAYLYLGDGRLMNVDTIGIYDHSDITFANAGGRHVRFSLALSCSLPPLPSLPSLPSHSL